jgi:hypothetical protein
MCPIYAGARRRGACTPVGRSGVSARRRVRERPFLEARPEGFEPSASASGERSLEAGNPAEKSQLRLFSDFDTEPVD